MDQTMEWQLIFKGVQEAIRDMRTLKEEMNKFQEFKSKNITNGLSDQLKKELTLAKDIVNQKGEEINSALGNIGKNTSGTGITVPAQSIRPEIALQ